MYKFKYSPNIEVLPEIVDEISPLYETIVYRERILRLLEEKENTPTVNSFKQAVIDLVDDHVVNNLKKTLSYLKEIEMFDTLFTTNCSHEL
jgi:hypothetical protein